MPALITPSQWAQYDRDGFLKLGHLLSDRELANLCRRIDDIMLGKAPCDYDRMLMQLDSDTGKYEDAPQQTKGFKGSMLGYRKIQDLEYDPLFLAFMQRPIFQEICGRHYGTGTPISSFRAMFMNKPAHKGTFLPWHQDRWQSLDRDPLVTIWTGLDPATKANGCVQVIPGSHRLGVINPAHHSGFLSPDHVKAHCQPEKVVYLEAQAGETLLLHNWLVHASDVNRTETSRRAFSVCYMDAQTRTRQGESFPVVFGPDALTPGETAAV